MKYSKELKAGVVVIISLTILWAGINYLMGLSFWKPQQKFHAVYENIANLATANPVVFNGFKVGQVYETALMEDGSGRILVTMIIYEEQLKIRKDARLRIVSLDLLGSKAVEIHQGDSAGFAVPGDTLMGEVEASLGDAVNEQIRPLKNKAEELMASVDSALTTIESIFNDQAKDDLNESFTSIREALSTFRNTTLRLDTLMIQERVRISAILSNMQSITANLANSNDDLARTLSNFEAISDSLAKADIKTTVNNAKTALAGASEVMDKINAGEGTLGMLINNDTLYTNLTQASQELELLLEDMRIHPNRYLHFSVFGKRDKSAKLSKKDLKAIQESLNENE